MPLPIEPALPALRDAFASRTAVVLQAPPGAGKTTLVPPAMLGAPWLGGRRILMLEPRRLAARAAAYRMAEVRGERVGETVGFRTRVEQRVGRDTRIEVVTEGILTRRLQRDPTLDDVGLVIFDEFHERSLNADVGLALTLRTRELLRDDLRVLIMSATLDGTAVAALLDDAPVIASEGRAFRVDTRYVPPKRDVRIEAAVASAVRRALEAHDGDVLVFLPGVGEIRRVQALLEGHLPPSTDLAPLHGTLTQDAQVRAIAPAAAGRRKVVLATSIAETSLTIEGVRVVVDSGLARVPRFSPRSGMTALETVRVSRASAEQRRGRAGRLGPGVCYRLWPEHENEHLLPFSPPEILTADLAPLALDLAAAGVDDPAELRWLDAPPPAALAQGRELLRELDALDAAGLVTAHGRRIADLPAHPRLAHMLLRASQLGVAPLACDIAALLAERDVLRSTSGPLDADLALRIHALRGERGPAVASGAMVDEGAVHRARADARRFARALGIHDSARPDIDAAGQLLALAYPDRLGQRRPGTTPRFVLRNGRGAVLGGEQSLARESYIVAADLDDQRPDSRIFVAAPITLEEILRLFAAQIITERVVEWKADTDSVVAVERDRLGALVLRESRIARPSTADVGRALLDEIRRRGIDALPWSDAARRLRDRIRFAARVDASWPDLSDAALLDRLDSWLGESLAGVRRWSDLQRVDLSAALLSLLDWRQRAALDELAPSHITVPTGSRIPVDYADPSVPVLAVRLQEVFGLEQTPRVGGGRVPVTMHLLSPAHRPVQVTQDLAGFWRTSYFDVRKDLRGRYPKHEWPDDPLNAAPTRRAKRRP